MTGGTDDEREILVDLAVRQSPPRLHRPLEMVSLPIPEELLPDIFLRLPDPADLVRASAACVSFRRLVADRSFLRQYRKRNAPPLLGFLFGCMGIHFQPAIAPHRSAPAASAVALAADFSFDFLPAPVPARFWRILDVRDGRVLLFRTCIQFVVCDPLHRQYLMLPPIPDEVFASKETWEIFLIPPVEAAAEETEFRVIWMAKCGDNLVFLVFSSSTGQWQAGPSHGWIAPFNSLLRLPGMANPSRHQYAYGCLYSVLDTRNMVTDRREKLLVLDTTKMELSIADAPSQAKGAGGEAVAIVEAGEGRPGMFVLPHDTTDISFFVRRNKGGSSVRWQLEKTISLGFRDRFRFAGSMGRHLFLEHTGDFFSLDVKTFQLETVCALKDNRNIYGARPYSNFPPSLSSPTVASGELHNASISRC